MLSLSRSRSLLPRLRRPPPHQLVCSCTRQSYRSYHSTTQSTSSSRSRWISLAVASIAAGGIFWYQQEIVECRPRTKSQDVLVDHVCRAASQGDIEQVQKLIQQHPQLVSARHPYGWTPLLAAAANNRLDIVKYLIEHGADVNATDRFVTDWDPDLLTSRQQFHSAINPQLSLVGWSPLHYAVALGHLDVVKYLLMEAGADPDLRNAERATPDKVIAWDRAPERRDDHIQIKEWFKQARELKERERKQREKEERRKFPLDEKLKSVMVGQLMPIYSVTSALRRRDAGWHDSQKPLVFLFLGSSGVGKTMLAKQLAELVNKDKENGFIRIDMSEYASKHEMARLIGSPPGYVGYEEGGQLTTKLAKCPDAVVLLDEVEKAHSDVLTLMLQVFDEGRLTDGKGNTISCPNAVFIMTSNLVQDEIRYAVDNNLYALRPSALQTSQGQEGDEKVVTVAQVAKQTEEFLRKTVHPVLKRHFRRDEFLGRINDMVVFHPFSQSDLQFTVNKELERWKQRAKERHNINLRWTERLVDSLINGYDERYGYRSIIYTVEKRVVNVLAMAHEQDKIASGSQVELDYDETSGEVVIKQIGETSATSTFSSSSSSTTTSTSTSTSTKSDDTSQDNKGKGWSWFKS